MADVFILGGRVVERHLCVKVQCIDDVGFAELVEDFDILINRLLIQSLTLVQDCTCFDCFLFNADFQGIIHREIVA